jgi:hypothetical protein
MLCNNIEDVNVYNINEIQIDNIAILLEEKYPNNKEKNIYICKNCYKKKTKK